MLAGDFKSRATVEPPKALRPPAAEVGTVTQRRASRYRDVPKLNVAQDPEGETIWNPFTGARGDVIVPPTGFTVSANDAPVTPRKMMCVPMPPSGATS